MGILPWTCNEAKILNEVVRWWGEEVSLWLSVKWGRANVNLPHAVTSIWPRIVWSSFRDAHIHVEENLEVMARNCFVWRPSCKHIKPDCTGGHGSKWEHFEAGTSQALTYLPALPGDRIMWLTQALRTVWADTKALPFREPGLLSSLPSPSSTCSVLYRRCAKLYPKILNVFICSICVYLMAYVVDKCAVMDSVM